MQNELVEGIKKAMSAHENPKEGVELYLFKLARKMSYSYKIQVRLQNLNTSKIITFHDANGNQLKTLADMLFYMESGENQSVVN